MEKDFNYSVEECFILKFLFDEFTTDINRPRVELNALHSKFFPKELKKNIKLWIDRFYKEGLVKDQATRGNDLLFDITSKLFPFYEENKSGILEKLKEIPPYSPMYKYLAEKGDDKSELPETVKFSGRQRFDSDGQSIQNPQSNFLEVRHALSNSDKDEQLISQGYVLQGLIGYILDIKSWELNLDRPALLLEQDEYEPGKYMPYLSPDISYEKRGIQLVPQMLGFIPLDIEGIPIHAFTKPISSKDVDYLVCSLPLIDKLEQQGYLEDKELSLPPFLFDSPNENTLPLYVYSTSKEDALFDPLPNQMEALNKQTDADLLQDNPSYMDDLGRKEVVRLVFNKVTRLWDNIGEKESYTILLNGEWGSGKSSMLLYFNEFLKGDNWEVIDYNAWKHQHLEDQWWILVNMVSKRLALFPDVPLFKSHWWWSNWTKNKITMILLMVLLIGYVVLKFNDPLKITEDSVNLYDGLLALIGAIILGINGIINSIFSKASTSSELAKRFTDDPYEIVQKRFNKVTYNRKVAIFIDDLDRCEIEPTVSLLEGIQNLFKQTKVLYVIAADGNWVSNCFDKKYQDFQGLGYMGHSIGSQFLQKSFQMVLDVPKIGKEQHVTLWKKYLGIEAEANDVVKENDQIESEIEAAQTSAEVRETAIDASTLSQRVQAAEKVEELVEKDDHLLLDYLEWIPANPRQMKRLINQFIVKYQTLIIAGNISKISEEALIRYVIFSTTYPDHDVLIKSRNKTLEQIKEQDERVKKLFGETELSTEAILELL